MSSLAVYQKLLLMPRIVSPLNDSQIRALKPRPTRYSISDERGLILEIMPTGKKVWRFRYSLGSNRQPMVTIGDYGKVSLRAARLRAQKYAAIVADGLSPVAVARQDRGVETRTATLRECGEQYFAAEIANKSPGYRRVTRQMLDKDIYPAIGNNRLGDVTATAVLAICDRIKARGAPQIARQVRNIIKRLYGYAIARQLVETNPASIIPARTIATPQSRTRVLSPNEIGTVLRAAYASATRRSLKLALHLLMLTMVRKVELIEATWEEFDLDEGLWRIPAERMKMRREHWVYLPHQAIVMLEELLATRTSPTFVFPALRGKDRPMSGAALNLAFTARNLGVDHFVLHDLRRTASTHLHEMGQPSDAIEKALAHSIGGVRGIYNRAEYARERRQILQLELWLKLVYAA